ncbi:heterogeneous nuclear ribonucleoprotein [Stylonychia lemnae]|uniref:Heterogeneous nuclear ribonucleoprotein n=1 Tax=Stylonychia lemnae TaxID=5949 RepID=A0A078AHJ3_STYLE|nr:heterogeneous nuclear ribonucleoprotein [Stylonychia lemnae]|eukprot:CDW80303.1 heterogeneous nuclear ribonucleoprotein [Stylonychia lemnae]
MQNQGYNPANYGQDFHNMQDPNSGSAQNQMFGLFGGMPGGQPGQYNNLMGGNPMGYNQPNMVHDPNQQQNGQQNQGNGNSSHADVLSYLQKLQQIVATSTSQSSSTNGNMAIGQQNQRVNEQQQNKGLTQQQNSVDQIVGMNSNNSSATNNQNVQSLNQLQSANTSTATLNPNTAVAQANANPLLNPALLAAQNQLMMNNMPFANPMMNPGQGVLFPGMMGGPMDMGMAGGAFNPYMMPYPPSSMFPGSGSAAAFQVQGPKNEIKLFVGGLQFQTMEQDLFAYFSQFGQVGDAIVMRDKNTGRGRGFGFIRLIFKEDDEAAKMKDLILNQNKDHHRGHYILDKKVDVKSADDYQGKQNPLQQQLNAVPGNPLIQKPNPYVIAETKTNAQDPGHVDVTFKYPKTKIFVGGLDFKLTVEELKQHFSQYGEVVDAIILKDIYTGQSRGFGFVSFKDEDVAQNLIRNILVTTINGRKADIKTAEPKLNPFIPQKGHPGQMQQYNSQNFDSQPAMIPPYGSRGGYDDQSRSNSRDRGRSDKHHHHKGDQRGGYKPRHRGSSHSSGDRRSRSRSGEQRRRNGRGGMSRDKDSRDNRKDHRDRGDRNDRGKRGDYPRSSGSPRHIRNRGDSSPRGGGHKHHGDQRDKRR